MPKQNEFQAENPLSYKCGISFFNKNLVDGVNKVYHVTGNQGYSYFSDKPSLLFHSNYIVEATLNSKFTCCIITHISLASQFWDIGKQCRPRSDAAERGV